MPLWSANAMRQGENLLLFFVVVLVDGGCTEPNCFNSAQLEMDCGGLVRLADADGFVAERAQRWSEGSVGETIPLLRKIHGKRLFFHQKYTGGCDLQ